MSLLTSPTKTYTAKPVTSIEQSPVFNGHLYLLQLLNITYKLNLFKEVNCRIWPLFPCLKGDLLIQFANII
jgi:hypothetical protein